MGGTRVDGSPEPWADRMNGRLQRIQGGIVLVAIAVLVVDILWIRLQTGSWSATVHGWVVAVLVVLLAASLLLGAVTRDRLKRWQERRN